MKKKIIMAIVAAVMCSAFTIAASAASTSDIISKLQADGANSTQIAQAQDFFKSNSDAFTGAQLDTISTSIDKVESIMKADNVTDPNALPADAKAEVKSIVSDTAAATGVTVEFGKNSSGISTITITKDGQSYTIAANDSIPKTTGFNYTGILALLSVGVLLVAGSTSYLLISRRKSIAA